MHPGLRNHHVVRIIDALRAIGPGASFERFGTRFMDAVLPGKLVHRGLDVVGNPVAGSVDSVSADGLIVGEYSAERTYFDGQMKKATGDIVHAMRLAPGATDIYLLSSRAGGTAAINAFKARAEDWPGMLGRTVHVLDARRIAETIVDTLLFDDAAMEDLAQYLPVLSHIYDEHSVNLTFPNPDRRHVARLDVAAEIERRLNNGPVLAVWGMGGSGKSEAAARFGSDHLSDYYLRIWLSPEQAPTVRALRSVRLRRSGEERNVASLLAAHPCLLVLDDALPGLPGEELAALCGPGSHVILTRRQGEATDYAIPLMGREQAEDLLNHALVNRCPAAIFETIWSTVRGHPLTLGMMNKLAAKGVPWSDIEADCNAVGRMLDEDGKPLVDRLLERLRPFLSRELSVFAWARSASCDLEFLRKLVQPVGVRNIADHGLRTSSLPIAVRLHDVVFACLESRNWVTEEAGKEFDAALLEHVRTLAERKDVALAGFAATMKPSLERIARAPGAPPIALVALIEAWDPREFDPSIIPEPVELARRLKEAGDSASPDEVRLVIEALEGHYRRDTMVARELAPERLRARLPALEELAGLPGLTELQLVEIKHHKAKALKNAGETAAASILFEEILAGPHPMHEARLQLLRLYANDASKVERAAELAEEILLAAAEPGAVATTVTLATVEILPWGKPHWRGDFIARNSDTIEREIRATAAAGLDQSLAACAAVGRHWVTHDPDRFSRVLPTLPRKPKEALYGDRDLFLHAELLRLEALVSEHPDAAIQKRALELFELMKSPNAFQRQTHGQLLVGMGRFAEAEVVLQTIAATESTGWTRYWRSVALLGAGDPDGALTEIGAALDGNDHRLTTFRSRFLVQRYRVRRELGESGAADDLRDALAVADDEQERFAVAALLEAELGSELGGS